MVEQMSLKQFTFGARRESAENGHQRSRERTRKKENERQLGQRSRQSQPTKQQETQEAQHMRERDQEQGRGTRFDAEEVLGRCGRRKKKAWE